MFQPRTCCDIILIACLTLLTFEARANAGAASAFTGGTPKLILGSGKVALGVLSTATAPLNFQLEPKASKDYEPRTLVVGKTKHEKIVEVENKVIGSTNAADTTSILVVTKTKHEKIVEVENKGIAPTNTADTTSIFTAISSKLIRANTMHKVTISVESTARASMTFKLQLKTLQDYDKPSILHLKHGRTTVDRMEEVRDKVIASSEKVQISPGETLTLPFRLFDLPDQIYNLTITAKSQDGYIEFQDSSLVYKDTKDQSLLLQTDKPIYKPGEVVHFRVIMLNRFLRPMTDQLLDIRVLDPQQNVIKSWEGENLLKGIYSSKLELSLEPNLGDWILKVSANGQESRHTFFVDNYVLPKFKVDVNLPPFITFNNTAFTAEVKAAYTYGRPIKGECEIRISEYLKYGWSHPNRVVSKKAKIDGSVYFEFNVRSELETEDLTYEKEYEVTATVTDALTGWQQTGSAKIHAHQHAYKIEMIEQERCYKPGFPLTLTFKVVSQDGKPISNDNPRALKIEHGYSFSHEAAVRFLPIPAIGVVRMIVETPSNELLAASSVQVTYKNLIQTFYPPQRIYSLSRTYMDIRLNNRNPPANSVLTVEVKLNKPFASLTYVLHGRGLILDTKRISLPNAVKHHTFLVKVSAKAAPEATLLVYTIVQPTFEVVVDSTTFTVNCVFDNFLNMSLSKQVAEPGEIVNIAMATTAGSVIAVRGVDQSVLLLKEDRDITVKTIEDEVKTFQNQLNNYRLRGGSSAFQLFEEAGLIVLTNAVIEKPEYTALPYYRAEASIHPEHRVMPMGKVVESEVVPFAKGQEMEDSRISDGVPIEGRVAKNIPETWFWEEIQTNKGNHVLQKVVPDTLTSWIITGYSLSPETGIGLTLNPSTLRTFRPFFITLNKPYSIVKGEIFGLQVLVHNYMEHEVEASVTLLNGDAEFEFYEEGSKALPQLTKNVVVGGGQVKSVTFVIKPTTFGNVKLEVKATSAVAGDGQSQPLIVKPPGQKQTRNKAVLLDLSTLSKTKHTLKTDFPPNRVEGADVVKMSVVSDLLGSTINNLDKLLQMPCGSGEQNMLNFVPDIVILEYLTASGTLTPEIKAQATRFLESGYQRQLTYRHSDGSFSEFGESDLHGSTWLTAFVVRSFIAARAFITIDSNVIHTSLKFLSQKQQADGSFVEHGMLLHGNMKGGAADSYSLSAYVLLAFLESKDLIPDLRNAEGELQQINFDDVIKMGLLYISSAPLTLLNPYPLTLITYTLQAANHQNKNKFQYALEKLAKSDGDLTYWEPPKREAPKDNVKVIKPHHWEPQTKPVSVEMTAYALLMYLKDNNLEKALSVGRWLLGQRNAEGGFMSTQDTVVGLSAIGKFSLATRVKENDLTIKAAKETFQISKDNTMVLQEVFLPSPTQEVTFKAEGKGTALAQLTWSYYVEEKSEAPAFAVDVTVLPIATKASLELKICTSCDSSDGRSPASNMAVMEVNHPSGYAFDAERLTPILKIDRVKRFDLEDEDTKLNVYFESLNATEQCLGIPLARIFKVADPAPAYVSVYDYYDTTKRARTFYTPPEMYACEICLDDEPCGKENCT